MGPRALGALTAAAVALALAAPAAALPTAGVLRTGQSLAEVTLGMTKAQVLRAWGRRHGVCRDCARTTWYFNLRRFHPQGAAAVFRRGRVARAYTLWKPAGWRTDRGVVLGAPEASVTAAYGPLRSVACGRYRAVVARSPRATTAFYVLAGAVWGFGLVRPGADPCVG